MEKIESLVQDIKIAMFCTVDASGLFRSRPMMTQDAKFDGTLWFITSHESATVAEITANPRVNVAYASTGHEEYLSVSGTAEVLNDRAKIAEFWSPFLKAWFEGPDDPTIRCIRVTADEAEFWDSPGGKLGSLFAIAKGAITGHYEGSDEENKTVKF